MLLDDLFLEQTTLDKTTKFIVANKKTKEVLYYGTSEEEAMKVHTKKTLLLKPMRQVTIAAKEVSSYLEMQNMFY